MSRSFTVALTAPVLSFALLVPSSATAASCGSQTTRAGRLVFKDTAIRSGAGVTCARAKSLLRSFGRKRNAAFADCAVPAQSGDVCEVGRYLCSVSGPLKRRTGKCTTRKYKAVVRFREAASSKPA